MPRPRILFLAFYYPPARSAGVPRARYLSEQLVHRGWEVTVVTPAPSSWSRPEDPADTDRRLARDGIRRLSTGMRHTWRMAGIMGPEPGGAVGFARWAAARASARLGFDRYAGWEAEIERACAPLAPGDIDVVLATGSPFVSFPAARRVADRLGVPFVLDYRDPWTDNPHGSGSGDRKHRSIEDSLLADAGAVVTVSEGFASLLGGRIADPDKIHVISNGYCPTHLRSVTPTNFGHFAIVHAGQLYPPKRIVDPLLLALREFDRRRPDADWRFHCYGPHGRQVTAAAARVGLAGRVVDHGRVSRAEALSATCGAGLAAVITSVLPIASAADLGVVPGKAFEAIGLGTPVLAIGPAGSDLDRILRRIGRGAMLHAHDTIGIAAHVGAIIDGPPLRPTPPEEYGWPSLGMRLDLLLRGVVGVDRSGTGDDDRS